MEIASIKGDEILLLYHPAEADAGVGEQFSILELPSKTDGLVAQVISNDSLEYSGLQQEMIQQILEEQITRRVEAVDREQGMGEIKRLKVATAKIRKRIRSGNWQQWDGWIPTRNVEIRRINAKELLDNVLPEPMFPIGDIASFDGTGIQLDGPRLNMVNVVTGVKGSGKSHLAKHLVLALSCRQIPCIIFDVNGEYLELPHVQVLSWRENFLPNLADVGHDMLRTIVGTIYPLQPGSASEAVFESRLPAVFNSRRQRCADDGRPFTIDIPYLRRQKWGGGDFVENAIDARLEMIGRMGLFATINGDGDGAPSLASIYDRACAGHPVVFDMRELSTSLRRSLVQAINRAIEEICRDETREYGQGRYPFVFFEEAHFYVSEAAIVNLITRGRHIGIASVFVTNTPQDLPDTVFRQLDNLFLLSLTHRDDIRNVSRNSFTDQDTIQSFATRMPVHHALVMGNVTDRYPLVVKVEQLPPEIPTTGRTKSTWDRLDTNQRPLTNEDITEGTNEEVEEIDEDDFPF